jgi:hypothetical protein
VGCTPLANDSSTGGVMADAQGWAAFGRICLLIRCGGEQLIGGNHE